MKKKLVISGFWILIIFFPFSSSAQTWDVINKSMAAWNADGKTEQDKAWKLSKTYLTATQETGYVNIKKTSGADGFLTPTSYPVTATGTYTIDIKARINATGMTDTQTAFEANKIAITIAGKMILVYLKYGDANNGRLFFRDTSTPDSDEMYVMNTSEWHTYRFVFHPAKFTYDVYVDNFASPIFSGVKAHYNGSANSIFIGSDKDRYCNMDIESVKFGTENASLKTQINNVIVSSDSHVVGNARTITTVTVNTDLVDDGQKVFVALFDDNDNIQTIPIELTIANNTVSTTQFTMPATLAKGKYNIKAYVENNKVGNLTVNPAMKEYDIVNSSPLTAGILPQVEPIGFIINVEDYQYKSPTDEYVFPIVVDTKKHLGNDGKFLDGTIPHNRYYWFHAPHDPPAGVYLYTGSTLDGSWTEQGIIMSNDWANQYVSTNHISSPHIIWNNVYNKYFMYFHGDNNKTNYATSDNLIDWTFGSTVVTYEDFSFGSREASYAKVFEYTVPGYDNKYVMMIMVNENNARTIFWAHSKDGIDWKGVRTPLVTPKTAYKRIPGTNTKPSYNDNVSGPFFMIADNRYFVFFHSSAGNISLVEIGEKFDMEIHWGTYMSKSEAVISDDGSGNMSAVSRVASPFFIQDDLETWYLFFEAGHRLGANTAYAKGETPNSTNIKQNEDEPKKSVFYYKLGTTHILKNNTSIEGNYKIFNLTGNLLKTGILAPGNNNIDIDNNGVYIISIHVGENSFTLKAFQ
ncbi:MAG: hypothetical protein ACK5L7_00930 [Paludibacteraceae bacterium]